MLKALSDLKPQLKLAGRGARVHSLTEKQLRQLIRKAAKERLAEVLAGKESTEPDKVHFQEVVEPALRHMADGESWPMGAELSDSNLREPDAALNLRLTLPLPGSDPKSYYVPLSED